MKAVLMAGSALRRLARDRLAVFFIVLLPVVIIAVIGITFGDAASERLPVGVADEGAGPSATTCGPRWPPPRPLTPAPTTTPTPSARRSAAASSRPGWSCPPATTRRCGPARRPR